MYLKRTIYDRLLEWKKDTSRSTLELNGARQVGKTYLINKFADENFEHKIYINLFELSGKQFMECYRKATELIPGNDRPENPLHDAFRLYDKTFKDEENTVIIIDEIQESAEIYNRISEFTRQFKAYFMITGSYLGRVLEPEFKSAGGDITRLQIYTLSFKEFLEALDEELYKKYLDLPLLSADENRAGLYEQLKEVYGLYCQIGGYPKVVETYLKKKDMLAAQEELARIIRIFSEESTRYFRNITDVSIFRDILPAICRTLLREKKGLEKESIREELQEPVTELHSSNISKETWNRALNWLYHSGMIGYCGIMEEMDDLGFKQGRRCFFMDLGITSYYLKRAGATETAIADILKENYEYINLMKRQDFQEEEIFETPLFAIYRGEAMGDNQVGWV
ncbi:AAA family ATPase [Lacrimispora sp. 210928-DFI.3.58]|uniref:AAA family ATPase n=1 Tax=Lacrimispora sp. 210928-DFI.3.58 TaxID=2883214 RepID=UPI0015B4DD38|nr:AAA family ATPase [Lacrimispora sp. 210928-DFI.3.58]MCB7317767.1 AAA family ATPase [Lacrimispora sp. 210928-DFI.3.58]